MLFFGVLCCLLSANMSFLMFSFKISRKGLDLFLEFERSEDEGRREQLKPERCRQILNLVSDDDARKLGFDPKHANPAWMILTVLPVPPIHVRPVVMQGNQVRIQFVMCTQLLLVSNSLFVCAYLWVVS